MKRLLTSLFTAGKNSRRSRPAPPALRRKPFRPELDMLEERAAPAVFTVNAVDDDPGIAGLGVYTTTHQNLRGAMTAANLTPLAPGETHTIRFNIPGAGVHTISPLRDLPAITNQQVTINGASQPGFAGMPLIELTGSNSAQTTSVGLRLAGNNDTVRGLAINRFSWGIWVSGSNDAVEGCFIGTDPTGMKAAANYTGILVAAFKDHPSANNRVGGPQPGQSNLISGNKGAGIAIRDFSTRTSVQGNFIGTDLTGTRGLGNGGNGVSMSSANNLIGGPQRGQGNLTSGNAGNGVWIGNETAGVATGNSVQGNFIGTDNTGTAKLANGGSGVLLKGATQTLIGGAAAGARNVISGNDGNGVAILDQGTTQNLVQGNFIGTRRDGFSPLGNAVNGVLITDASDNRIGGPNPGEGNVIAFNGSGQGTAGVFVTSGTGNAIRVNSIFANKGLGIDLSPAGVNPNHSDDRNTGPNKQQNFLVLSFANTSRPRAADGTGGNGTMVLGTFHGKPNTWYTVDLFYNPARDPSDYGQGQTFLASLRVLSNATGSVNVNYWDKTVQLPVGQFVSATATDPDGNTSEFSRDIRVNAVANLQISIVATPSPATVGKNLTYTVTVKNTGPERAPIVYLRDTLPAGVTFVSAKSGPGSTYQASAGVVTFNLGPLEVNSTVTATIVVVPTQAGKVTDTAKVTTGDEETSLVPDQFLPNRTATCTVDVMAPHDPSVPYQPFMIRTTQNAHGDPVVFAIDADHALWENNPAFNPTRLNLAWKKLTDAPIESISATRNAQGDPVVFAIPTANHSLWENNPVFNPTRPDLAWKELTAATAVTAATSISAAQNAKGDPVVFAITTTDHSLWENNPAFNTVDPTRPELAWKKLTDAAIESISAARNAQGEPVAFAVPTADHSLWENNPAFNSTRPDLAWKKLTDAAVASVSAVQSAAGDPVVYAIIAADHSLWENSSVFNSTRPDLAWKKLTDAAMESISAARNAQGDAVVFAVTAQDHTLWENNSIFNPTRPDLAWKKLSDTAVKSISATRNAQGDAVVDTVFADFSLWENNPVFNPSRLDLAWAILASSNTKP